MMVLMIEDELARFFFHFNGGPLVEKELIFSVILMGPGALL